MEPEARLARQRRMKLLGHKRRRINVSLSPSGPENVNPNTGVSEPLQQDIGLLPKNLVAVATGQGSSPCNVETSRDKQHRYVTPTTLVGYSHFSPSSPLHMAQASDDQPEAFNASSIEPGVILNEHDCSVHTKQGFRPPMFVISGQNYHSIGSLLPQQSSKPKFAQLYFYDTENEVQNRINAIGMSNQHQAIDHTIVADLTSMLDSHNSLAKCFRYARQRFTEDSTTPLQLRLIKKRNTDGRRYNLPSASEVAALILHKRYLALQYPLLFPYGEDGFQSDILISDERSKQQLHKRETISMREFLSFRIQMRSHESQVLLKSRRLFQQFLVDSYTMVEAERLQYHRFHQSKFRSHQPQGLHECLIQGERQAARTGKRVILPSSFVGGPRYMYNNCKDSFAICRYAGYPSYFITITCNPEWTEIKDCVAADSLNPSDRPDIISRVFKIKLDVLMKDLKDGSYSESLKEVIVYTVEFQKRGLPHCHILLFVQPTEKPRSSEDIDHHISAEIPDEHTQPKLYSLVQKFMIHGPCGVLNMSSPCMVNGRCSKFYPVPFREKTSIDSAGFPRYKRSDNGRSTSKRNVNLDNRFVVPYNATLLLKYGCHINVEYTCQTSVIKYLFKYVHKGNDRVTASFFRSHDSADSDVTVDEIQNYYDCRYISACEAS
ncbi:uncharacterized protein [Arachis hypogaea]|uniref:uncharacterized protein n=1 Tax=Arachis hypogaea TaxID=3818 RepID=UPI000DECAB2C